MTPAPEQEAGEGVARADVEELRRLAPLVVKHATDAQIDAFDRIIEALSSPSPHEGEAASPVWGGYESPFLEPPDLDPEETAPTEPRSISEEARDRLNWRVQAMAEGWCPCQKADTNWPELESDLRALLAAYEQAEARADTWKGIAESHRDENLRLEAERDTAQASEARLREDVTRAVSEFKSAAEACERAARQREDSEGPEPINTGKAAAYRITAGRLNRALASTPNPEERACTCPPSAFTGYYTPANSCPRHGSAPDPTPEPEEGRPNADDLARVIVELMDTHEEWCGYNREAPGNSICWEATAAAEEVLRARDPAPTDPTTEEGR